MAVPPPFTLAVPVERGSSVRSSESLPSPTAGFAAGFAAGGPPPSVDVSGNSSKEAASPRQSRSSSKEAATPKRVRLCGSYVPSGRSSASASVSSGSPDDSFKQAPAAAAASAAAASAAGAAAQPSPPRHHAREVVLPLQTAAAADLPPAEPVPAVRAASAASERYSDDEELAALGPPPGRSASQESLDAELAALGPPPTLDGRLRDSEASDFVFEDEEDATTRLAADAAAAAAGAPAVLPPSVASSERNSGGGHPERNSAVRWHSPILGGSKVSSTESLPRRSAGSPGTSPGLAAVLTVSTPPEEEELRPPMVRGRSVSMGALQPERAATSPGSSGVAGGRGSAPLPVAPPVARTRSHESSPTQTPPELRSPIFGSPSCAACDPSVWQQYGAGGGAVPASPRRCRPRRPSRASMGDEGSFTLGDSSLPRTPGAGGGSTRPSPRRHRRSVRRFARRRRGGRARRPSRRRRCCSAASASTWSMRIRWTRTRGSAGLTSSSSTLSSGWPSCSAPSNARSRAPLAAAPLRPTGRHRRRRRRARHRRAVFRGTTAAAEEPDRVDAWEVPSPALRSTGLVDAGAVVGALDRHDRRRVAAESSGLAARAPRGRAAAAASADLRRGSEAGYGPRAM